MARATYDAVIVGGGHNGLVAAWYLADAGLRVIVLERRELVGGPSARKEFFPGYHAAFTNSPSQLEARVIRDMELERFGLRFLSNDPSVVVPFPDGRRFEGWRDPVRLKASLAQFSKQDAERYHLFSAYVDRLARTIGVSIFADPPSLKDIVSKLTTEADEDAFVRLFFGSVRELMDEWFESEEIKSLVGMVGIMGNTIAPSAPGSAFALMIRAMSKASDRMDFALANPGVEEEADTGADFEQGKRGVRGGLVKGGPGSIVAAMRTSIEARGATVRTDAEVTEIVTDTSGVRGVLLADGTTIEARLVLSNLNPHTTFGQLIDPSCLEPPLLKRVMARPMLGSQGKLVLALDGVPTYRGVEDPDLARRLVSCAFRIAPTLDYIERAYAEGLLGQVPTEPMLWATTPSMVDPSLAPAGKQLMNVSIQTVPYKLAANDWSEKRDELARNCIDVLAKYFPDIKSQIVDYRCFTPADLEQEFGLIGSNIMHGDFLPANAFSWRPLRELSRYRTPIAGLYLCGSGTWPWGLVSGVPGYNAGHQVLKDLAAGRSSRSNQPKYSAKASLKLETR